MSSQLTETVVRIREMILRGELAPGQRVAEAPLAETLGMSRTPVRQALPLLAQEGLLTEHETRGYVVRAFTAADIIDAIELRAIIEGLAWLGLDADEGPFFQMQRLDRYRVVVDSMLAAGTAYRCWCVGARWCACSAVMAPERPRPCSP